MISTVRSSPLTVYFAELDAGRFDGALATFAPSCVYIRPALTNTAGDATPSLLTMHGRSAIRSFFDERGVLALTHRIGGSVVDGRHCFVQGTAIPAGPPRVPQSLFMAHAVLDDDGLITRFLALSAPLNRPMPCWAAL